jgi:CBS domain-containing protein
MVMIARDIMTPKVYTVFPEATVQEVAQLLSRERISGVPVIDRSGKVIGVVTETDIIRNVTREGLRVADIMSPEIITVDEETRMSDVAMLFSKHKISRAPVMRNNELVGIVCRSDIVRAVAQGYLVIRQW